MWKGKITFPEKFSKEWLRKDRLLILLLCGILLLVITIPIGPSDDAENSGEAEGNADLTELQSVGGNMSAESYAGYMEAKLEAILSLTENAGEVRVMITLEDGGEKVVEKDTESTSETIEEEDSEGGARTSNSSSVKEVSIYEGENEDSGNPYITKEKSPVVAGVLVIAQGGDNAVVVRNITEAVQALFDIDTHKIKVIKGN